MAGTTTSTGPSTLVSFDLSVIVGCATELAEATAAVQQTEWQAVPTDIEGPESPHFEQWNELHRRRQRLGEESDRLKRALGAEGPLQLSNLAEDNEPNWHSFEQRFNDTIHGRAVRLALTKLATAAIDLSGFAHWRELHWGMRDTGYRLLMSGLAQLWAGLPEQHRTLLRQNLQRTNEVVGSPIDLTSSPPTYDGPEEIPLDCQYRIYQGYVSCPADYLEHVQVGAIKLVEDGHRKFLRLATLPRFLQMVDEAVPAIEALVQKNYDPAEWGDYYEKAFWALKNLSRAHEVQPREAWPCAALEHRQRIAQSAGILFRWIGGTPFATPTLEEEAHCALSEFRSAAESLCRLQAESHELSEDVQSSGDSVGARISGEPDSRNAIAALLSVFTNGVVDERIEQAANVLQNATLSADDKVKRIDKLIPLPPTASAEDLGKMVGVTKQAILKGSWWLENRKGEKKDEIGRRSARHRERTEGHEPSLRENAEE